MDPQTFGLPRPCWALLGGAILLAAGAWTFLATAEYLNASTPHLEVPLLSALIAALLATSAIVVEFVRTARRPREARARRSGRIVFHLLAIAVMLVGLYAGFAAFVAATFPTC